MAEIAKWRKFENAIKAKRTNVAINNNSKSGGKVLNNGGQCDVSILERKELTVQPLTTEATAAVEGHDYVGSLLDAGKQTDVIYMDMSKALQNSKAFTTALESLVVYSVGSPPTY
ncbi:Hypothetical predicted protein [Paramuricea clavata]|uniref:Uncharacterized protein n=1 Tax=Paramuricea clavata TaxID=317549 RepID=A0A6S7G960_PARCT|nr:Hypothetical predicted protein [Paramuricea clavata]